MTTLSPPDVEPCDPVALVYRLNKPSLIIGVCIGFLICSPFVFFQTAPLLRCSMSIVAENP